MKISTTMLAAAAAVLLAAPVRAQDVTQQLAEADSLLRAQGMTPTGEPVVGTLAAEQETEFTVEMQAGVRYTLLGVCDGGCSDMDLSLADERGRVIVEDLAPDDVPVLVVEDASGTYTVKVRMAACSTATCQYGVRTFQGTEP